MAKKRVKGLLTVRVSLTPGICRWCRCTDHKPCVRNCSWVDRTHTLCSECWPFDHSLQTAAGRQRIAELLQEQWWQAVDVPMPPKKARLRRAAAR